MNKSTFLLVYSNTTSNCNSSPLVDAIFVDVATRWPAGPYMGPVIEAGLADVAASPCCCCGPDPYMVTPVGPFCMLVPPTPLPAPENLGVAPPLPGKGP